MNRSRILTSRVVFSLGWTLAFLLSLVSSISAQTTGTITGEVKDTNSALLVGVQITATALETGVTRTTSSGVEGRFVFPALPVGTYELRAEHAGFEPLIPQTVRLTVNETVHVSLVLRIAGLTANVTVESGESLVNTEGAELSYLVNERRVRDLPLNGRNYTDLALLQPGVIAYTHRDGGSVVAHGLGPDQ